MLKIYKMLKFDFALDGLRAKLLSNEINFAEYSDLVKGLK